MIRKNLKALIIASIVILLPMVAGVLLWDKLPAQIPTHWNAKGQIDGWSSKAFAVFGLSGILLALQWLCVLCTLADPKRANHDGKILHLIFWIIPVLSLVLYTATYCIALGLSLRMEVIISMLMGLLFVIIGNYMPKCKQNYTIGIKVPWTLNSEENWNKTHRLAGWLWVGCGFAMIPLSFLGAFLIFFCVVIAMVAVPLVYSYILYRKGI